MNEPRTHDNQPSRGGRRRRRRADGRERSVHPRQRPLRLTVLTPAKTLLDVGNVAWVQVHLADGGGIGVYPGHAPLLAETLTAPLRYADPAGEHTLDLEAGILEIGQGSVTVFTNGPAHHEDTADMDHASADIADVDRASVCASDARFDRLAQALLDTLKEQADEVLGREDERGT